MDVSPKEREKRKGKKAAEKKDGYRFSKILSSGMLGRAEFAAGQN